MLRQLLMTADAAGQIGWAISVDSWFSAGAGGASEEAADVSTPLLALPAGARIGMTLTGLPLDTACRLVVHAEDGATRPCRRGT
ncbi:hypothetical protein DMA12_40340 [Amycolatopsis balhimycina DSM 5908]|uniref:Uncharacterized protein n=1 Tax=Amycolatopsis balhimycina DSM 5908 TaxID=1081091 RepID=A0A428W077_AMYBA|nr:hypothetical protein [Amycolatopsis balhimycina]RSM36474.1 hypothetical protein DMA12_40340 [Amycolatopsis balhimycina DSM 5908]